MVIRNLTDRRYVFSTKCKYRYISRFSFWKAIYPEKYMYKQRYVNSFSDSETKYK
jgi:hypothetical protein